MQGEFLGFSQALREQPEISNHLFVHFDYFLLFCVIDNITAEDYNIIVKGVNPS
jgi:hypothetical protein